MKIKSCHNTQQQNKLSSSNDTIQFNKERVITRNLAKKIGLNKNNQNGNHSFAAKNTSNLHNQPIPKKNVAKIQHSPCINLLANPSIEPLPEIRPHDIYQSEILQRILQLQNDPGFKIDPRQIKNHKVISMKTHMHLIKFVYKVCMRFFLKRTTFALAVFYFDKYISIVTNLDDQTILAAVQAALLIAMKYQEIYPPALQDWVSMKLKSRVLQIQAEMLVALDFKLAHFTLQHFYEYQIDKEKDNLKQEDKNFILKLIDLCIFDSKMYQFKASQLIQSIFEIVKKEASKRKRSMFYDASADNQIINAIKFSIERNNELFGWLESHSLQRSLPARYQY